MAIEIRAEVEGIGTTDQILSVLGDSFFESPNGILIKSIADTLREPYAYARGIVPVRKGSLKSSLQTRVVRFAGLGQGFSFNAQIVGFLGYYFPPGPGATPRVPQGLGSEFGSKRWHTPVAVLRRTWDRYRWHIERQFVASIILLSEQRATRIARAARRTVDIFGRT